MTNISIKISLSKKTKVTHDDIVNTMSEIISLMSKGATRGILRPNPAREAVEGFWDIELTEDK
jgi:hypothetical protein